MKKAKVFVIGYFGLLTNQLDGQTIKTRNIYELLKIKEGEFQTLGFFDTQSFQKSKFNIFKMLFSILRYSKVVYIPAHNNLKYLFPFIFILCWVKGIAIIYPVVGGWLSGYLQNKKIHTFLLKRIYAILPETKTLKLDLESIYHFNNVTLFPNFRIHDFSPSFVTIPKSLRIVFMARVNKQKGLEYIFGFFEYLNKNHPNFDITLDIYGPVEKTEEEYFFKELKLFEKIRYKGILEPDKIYYTLSGYDVLVLPTKYFTEGFPGSILDAYITGLPVVVTEWLHAHEFVSHKECGFIIPFTNGEKKFYQYLLNLYNDQKLLSKMKRMAHLKSKEYSVDKAWEILEALLIDKLQLCKQKQTI